MSQVTIYLSKEVEAKARREARRARKTLSAYIASKLEQPVQKTSSLAKLFGSMPDLEMPDDGDLAALDELRLCSVVKAELNYRARSSAKVNENLLRLRPFFEAIDSLDFDDVAAEQYGLIRAQLKRVGTPIGPDDLLIASIALAHDASLATRNVRQFARVPALRLEVF